MMYIEIFIYTLKSKNLSLLSWGRNCTIGERQEVRREHLHMYVRIKTEPNFSRKQNGRQRCEKEFFDWIQTPRIRWEPSGWVKGQTITNTGKFYRYIY